MINACEDDKETSDDTSTADYKLARIEITLASQCSYMFTHGLLARYEITCDELIWHCSDETVVTINSSGMAETLDTGEVIITVKIKSGKNEYFVEYDCTVISNINDIYTEYILGNGLEYYSGSYPVAMIPAVRHHSFYGDISYNSIHISACTNSEITELIITGGITSIESASVQSCANLRTVVLPSTLTLMGDSIFYDCPLLSDVTIEASVPPVIGDYVLAETSPDLVIRVPSTSVEVYKAAETWSAYKGRIVGY
jgi:hypothetical protein